LGLVTRINRRTERQLTWGGLDQIILKKPSAAQEKTGKIMQNRDLKVSKNRGFLWPPVGQRGRQEKEGHMGRVKKKQP